jgi:hypothetical protein
MLTPRRDTRGNQRTNERACESVCVGSPPTRLDRNRRKLGASRGRGSRITWARPSSHARPGQSAGYSSPGDPPTVPARQRPSSRNRRRRSPHSPSRVSSSRSGAGEPDGRLDGCCGTRGLPGHLVAGTCQVGIDVDRGSPIQERRPDRTGTCPQCGRRVRPDRCRRARTRPGVRRARSAGTGLHRTRPGVYRTRPARADVRGSGTWAAIPADSAGIRQHMVRWPARSGDDPPLRSAKTVGRATRPSYRSADDP